MKIKIVLLAFLLLGTIVPSKLIAQSYANPDAARMRLLLARIADCNNDIKKAEAEIEAYINLDSEISLELYHQLKENLAIATKCKEASQREYDDLRADYEGWFNESTSAMTIDRQRVTPYWLGEYIGQMVIIYSAVFVVFKKIPVPEH
ncbi:hypothetical protein [Seonamhaeicola sp.]|uniref:hypothetical protein n=1 Tax=Seonamhaeicola sp. TaxID=1912245 RepID=UPI00260D462E|nr:hypothetical protein [Seonamhaeicola sp.]